MARILSIIQLCLVFTLISWIGSYPFMGEEMAYKKQAFLFQTTMGTGDLVTRTYAHDSTALERLKRNQERFSNLPETQQNHLISAYNTLQTTKDEQSFLSRLTRSFSILLFELPPFERAWIFFSLIIAVALLLRSPGAPYAAWLLPLVVLAAAFDNQPHGGHIETSKEAALFPTEEYLVQMYRDTPLSGSILEEQTQLRNAWESYLITEWLGEKPSGDAIERAKQIEQGEYAFNLERLNCTLVDAPTQGFFYRETSLFIWMVYFVWNLLFAWTAFRSTRTTILAVKA